MTPHRTDVFSLVAGVLFCTLAVLFALDDVDVLSIDLRWIPAIVLLALGAAGIVASVTRDLRLRAASEHLRDEPA